MNYKLVHISDLHFGAHNDRLAGQLLEEINQHAPHLVIASGDFTQIGSKAEFRQAQDFLGKLTAPVFCVPGNHDIPRFNLRHRFMSPFARYKKFINPDLSPVSRSPGLVIAGANTARPILPHWNWAHGKISSEQLQKTKQVFEREKERTIRIFVCHHPLHEAAGAPLKTLVWGGRKALSELVASKTDLILTGHAHHASLTMLEESDRQTAALSASTALSTRLRGHDNGYNVIHIGESSIGIATMRWNGQNHSLLQEYILSR